MWRLGKRTIPEKSYDIDTLFKKRDIDGLLDAMHNGNWDEHIEAIKALGNLGNKKAVEPLSDLLHKNPTHEGRAHHILASLEKLGYKKKLDKHSVRAIFADELDKFFKKNGRKLTPRDTEKISQLLKEKYGLEISSQQILSKLKHEYPGITVVEEIAKKPLKERKGKDFCNLLKESIPNRFMNINPTQFEEFVAEMFSDLGYRTDTTNITGDYGADVILSKDNKKTAVQVKRYQKNNKVGVKEINQVIGARDYYGCDDTMVITTSLFTPAGKKLASQARVELWDWKKLDSELKNLYFDGVDVYEYFKEEYEKEKNAEKPVKERGGIDFELLNLEFMDICYVDNPKRGTFEGLLADIKVKNLTDKKIYFDFGGDYPPILIDKFGNQFTFHILFQGSFVGGWIYPHSTVILKLVWLKDPINSLDNIKTIIIRYRLGNELLPEGAVNPELYEFSVMEHRLLSQKTQGPGVKHMPSYQKEIIEDTRWKGGDLTNLLERLENFEKKLGIAIKGLYCELNDMGGIYDFSYINIYGEIRSKDNSELKDVMTIKAAIYDNKGRVVNTGEAFIENFTGFQNFKIILELKNNITPKKIRVYPVEGYSQ